MEMKMNSTFTTASDPGNRINSQKSVQSAGGLSLFMILGLWLAAAAVMFILAWYLVPLVVDRVSIPAALTYWLILMVGAAWQFGLIFWVIYRQEGGISLHAILRFGHLTRPVDPKTNQVRARTLWHGLRSWPLVFIILGVGVFVPSIIFITRRFFPPELMDHPLLIWPAYSSLLELTSAEFFGRWWMVPTILLGWSLFVSSEELFFRGLLLPRMRQLFGRWDCTVNALLFGLYFLFQYWMVPFRLIEGWVLAREAKRYQSTWMAIAIRGAEGAAVGVIMILGVFSQPLTASPHSIVFPSIFNRPQPSALYQGKLANLPIYNPLSNAPFQLDLRGADLSGMNLSSPKNDLAYADFDSRTIWADKSKMPAGFDPDRVMETGKNPGLGVRQVHGQGITGKGVSIAIIDQILLTEHNEYADRLRWYEELPGYPSPAQMHGPAVSSIAVGRTVGVAPQADLYYIGGIGASLSTLWDYGHQFAQAIRRIVQINAYLPIERKIRVISISSDWLPSLPGYQDASRAVREAEDAGIMVVTTGSATGMPENTFAAGLGRSIDSDPDELKSYEPGLWWANLFYSNAFHNSGALTDGLMQSNMLLFPMDSRTMASTAGANAYFFNRSGGQSWVVPYIAGLYALAAQANPAVTPGHFWNAAIETGRTIDILRDGKVHSLGKIVDPVALIQRIKTDR